MREINSALENGGIHRAVLFVAKLAVGHEWSANMKSTEQQLSIGSLVAWWPFDVERFFL